MISTNYKKIKNSLINKSKTKIMKKYISFALFIFVMSSCNKYYKVTTAGTGKNAAQTIEQLKNNGRYFVLRSGSQAFAMDSLTIDNKEQTLQCVLNILPEEHLVHLTKGTKGKMRYTELNGYEPDVEEYRPKRKVTKQAPYVEPEPVYEQPVYEQPVYVRPSLNYF